VCAATSIDNPYFPKHVWESRKRTMDPRRFAAMFGGKFEKMEGLVYDCWDDTENIVKPFRLPDTALYFGMIDWGFTHPFVLLVRAVVPAPSGLSQHYQVSEFFKPGQTIDDQKRVAAGLKSVWGIQKFFCGPDQPGSIEAFNRAGLVAVGADNDVRGGIDVHYDLVKSRRYQVFEGTSPHTVDQHNSYHYPEPRDLKPDQDDKEQNPVKQDDDAMDANRYGSVMLKTAGKRARVHQPRAERMDDHSRRIARLKKGGSRRHEEW
jgi:hypothetical protein